MQEGEERVECKNREREGEGGRECGNGRNAMKRKEGRRESVEKVLSIPSAFIYIIYFFFQQSEKHKKNLPPQLESPSFFFFAYLYFPPFLFRTPVILFFVSNPRSYIHTVKVP